MIVNLLSAGNQPWDVYESSTCSKPLNHCCRSQTVLFYAPTNILIVTIWVISKKTEAFVQLFSSEFLSELPLLLRAFASM